MIDSSTISVKNLDTDYVIFLFFFFLIFEKFGSSLFRSEVKMTLEDWKVFNSI